MSRALPTIAGALRSAADLVVPVRCVGCDAAGRVWCDQCSEACQGPALVVPGALPCRSAAPHHGPLGRAVVAFKDRGARRLAAPLGVLLAGAVISVLREVAAPGDEVVWLVPVPDRPAARRTRGMDHMSVLAARAAAQLRARGLPAHRCRLLHHARDSVDQLGLTGRRRWANVAGSLAARRAPSGLVIVVDDVTTTGATLAESAAALARCGSGPAGAATLTSAAATLASGPEAD